MSMIALAVKTAAILDFRPASDLKYSMAGCDVKNNLFEAYDVSI